MFDDQTSRPPPTTVLLARHAETVWNIERRFQGHLDSPLTERGVQQAELLAERLEREPLSAIYSSDLGRTLRTAQMVAARHRLEVQTSAALREIDTGVWAGLPRDQVKANPEWVAMLDVYHWRPAAHRFPGGEAIGNVQRRALAFLFETAPHHTGQTIAVITHHVVVEMLIAHALGVPLDELWLPYRGGNCFLSTLEVTADAIVPKVLYDGCHIGDLAGPDGAKGEAREQAGG